MITLALVALNLAAFGLELSMGGEVDGFVRRWGLVPSDVLDSLKGGADGPAAVVTLLTGMFLHAGWLHLLANVLYLAVFGPPVERRLGARGFALLYLASGLIGSIAYVAAQPTSTQPAIGASGAIAGVIAAHLVLAPTASVASRAPVLFLQVADSIPTLLLLLIWVAAQLFSSVASLTTSTGIAWWAHFGGFASGVVLAPVLRNQRMAK